MMQHKRSLRLWAAVLLAVLAVAASVLPALAQTDQIPVEDETAQNVNLIRGGDFEGDTLDERWHLNSNAAEKSPTAMTRRANDQGYALIWAQEACASYLGQSVSVLREGMYCLSADVWASGLTGTGGVFLSALGYEGTSEVAPGDENWHHLTLYIDAGDNAFLTVKLNLGSEEEPAGGFAYFDNVVLTEVEAIPAGASLAVLSGTAGESVAPVPKEEEETVNPLSTGNAALLLLAAVAAAGLMVCLYRAVGNLPEKQTRAIILSALGLALLLRIVIALVSPGHGTDMACFRGWSASLAQGGMANFYTSGQFADYPPGYLYILWLMGKLAALFGIDLYSVFGGLWIRLPAIAADLGCAWLLWRACKKRANRSIAAAVFLLCALNPAAILNSAAWGQVDSVLTLLLLGTFFLLEEERPIWSAVVYGLAVLVKPQALIAGPVFALWYLFGFCKKGKRLRAFNTLMLSFYAAIVVIFLGALPFQGSQDAFWLLRRYLDTATSYQYASVNALNLPTLLGGNWVSLDEKFLFLSWNLWGYLGIALSLGAVIWFALSARKKGTLSYPLLAAAFLSGVFALGHSMHERYLFPVLFLVLLAWGTLRDRRLLYAAAGLTGALVLNIGSVLLAAFFEQYHLIGDMDAVARIFSALSLAAIGYFLWVCGDICLHGRIAREKKPTEEEERAKEAILEERRQQKQKETLARLSGEPGKAPKWTLKEGLLLLALTAVYAVVAFVNLGDTDVPQSYWRAGDGSVAEVTFSEPVSIASVWTYGGISRGKLLLSSSQDASEEETVSAAVDYNVMFRWNVTDAVIETDRLILRTDGDVWLNELAFKDSEGNALIPASVRLLESGEEVYGGNEAVELLFDEQELLPERPTAQNGMYFDELYHGRTGLEHLLGLTPYENSHPPLGKIFIMAGIWIFGMTPFGWRFFGALFGVLMLPALYLLVRRITKKSSWALFAAAFFAVDFMHFAQTRIATIDVYGVFFIILMYYFMYGYYEKSFYREKFWKTLAPLGLSGLAFGLGAASKWIGIYAGAGLAVLFFATLWKRFMEYRTARLAGDAEAIEQTKKFMPYTIWTLVFCIGAFIVLPVAIYLLSYLPYFLCAQSPYDLEGVWGVQKFMFSYHSQLTATHPYESRWYTWPLTIRPIWYYMGKLLPEGQIASIVSMGNPVVWWSGIVGLLTLLMQRLRKKVEDRPAATFVLVGFAAQFAPWMLISRSTFIYHYFASVPFIIAALTIMLMELEKKRPQYRWVKWVLLAAAAVLFGMFYPILSGVPIPIEYARLLKWLPSWTFFIG